MGETPLFVVGVGRSGTSLIQSMLASHPAIVSLPETGFLRRRVFARGGTVSVAPATLWDGDARLRRIEEQTRRRAVAVYGDRPVSPADLYQAIRSAFGTPADESDGATAARDATERYLLDKDPRLIEHLPALFQRYPNAQVIHIIRDPRDVVLSKQRAGWSRQRPWWLNLLVGVVQLDRVERNLTPPQIWRINTVRYEDLIASPVSVLRRLCTALDLTYDPAMLEFGDAAQTLRATDESGWKDNVTGPLLHGNSGKWRREMSSFRQALCDRIARRHLRRGGYPRAGVTAVGPWTAAVVVATVIAPVRFALGVMIGRHRYRVRR